jgi:glycerol 3-phosphatase-2
MVGMSPGGLKASDRPLVDVYDCAMLDLDGVVYVGPEAVPGVPDLLKQARAGGLTLAFVTNNAARPPSAVAHHLNELGIEAQASDVVTSAQAAASLVAERVAPGSRVLVVGGEGLHQALTDRGLVPVSSVDDDPAAIVQGFATTVGWTLLAEAAYGAQRGLPWIASNLDLTVPTVHGIAPGNGALVNVVAAAAGRRPDAVAGKPFRPLFDETIRRIASTHPLVVGDRLDTDIEGAVACGVDSLLVMTGITDLAALCQAMPHQRPSYVSATMSGLMATHARPAKIYGVWHLDGWAAAVRDGHVEVSGRGNDVDDGLRVLAAACWDWSDSNPRGELALDGAAGILDLAGPTGP